MSFHGAANFGSIHFFETRLLIDRLTQHKIEAFDIWLSPEGTQILTGTADGAILRYKVHRNDSPFALTNNNILEFVEVNHSVSKKTLQQIAVVEQFGFLLVLTDNIVSVHSLETYVKRYELGLTKGSVFFSHEVYQNSLYVAAASKKKISIYIYYENDWQKKEYPLPEPTCLIWFLQPHEKLLCIGLKKEYQLINIENDQQREVFPPGKNGICLGTMIQQQSELLLSKDSNSIFVNSQGKASKQYGLTWTEPPQTIINCHPYVIGILQKHVEVRPVFQSNCSQILQTRGARLFAKKEELYIASQTSLWKLNQISFPTQIDELLRLNLYEDALQLCTNLDSRVEDYKSVKTIEIKTKYAFALFEKGDFEKAFDLFQQIQFDPLKVISLFPNLLPEKIAKNISYPYTPPRFLENSNNTNQAYQQLIDFLVALQKKQAQTTSKNADTGKAYGTDYDLIEVIDTTLFKAYLNSNENLLLPFLRTPNKCNVSECEKDLLSRKKIPELVQLYRSRSMHEQALMQLVKYCSEKKSHKDIIEYLQKLGKNEYSLILKFALKPMQESPEQAVEIFKSYRDEANELPPTEVSYFIEKHASKQLISYLEYIIDERKSLEPEFHTKLALKYIESLKVDNDPNVRSKLKTFLEKSNKFRPEKIIQEIPNDNTMLEEKTIVLKKLNQHEEALRIWVLQLKRPDLAEL
eukprot:TRINITY_DN2730_c0_g1_i1.p1 TRINITY_DN2730_c0_g1~~TRINITY_DN2730_c0_g1_i1.p1  ORF type:complete len:727 (-),score=256.89 TRINITY_DN2730_c0_g1_i1:32-2110(-)